MQHLVAGTQGASLIRSARWPTEANSTYERGLAGGPQWHEYLVAGHLVHPGGVAVREQLLPPLGIWQVEPSPKERRHCCRVWLCAGAGTVPPASSRVTATTLRLDISHPAAVEHILTAKPNSTPQVRTDTAGQAC
jgi:hypothetical protein